MKMKAYHTAEFARLAGVTIRTLRYYDREGLLQPTQRTERNYRLYQQSDLLRLQQILTLKVIGFSLEDICALLSHLKYTLQQSLHIQKMAIDQQIEQLHQTSLILAQTLQEVKATSLPSDWTQIVKLIRVFSENNKQQWLSLYFIDE